MLKSMRRSVQSTFVKVFLFGLLIITFGLWGVTDIFFTSPESRAVAEVDGEELDFPTYVNLYQQMLRSTGLQQAGIELDANSGAFIEQAVLGNWALGIAINREVTALRLAVTDAEVRDQIRRDPTFRDGEGNFSRTRFELFLAQNGVSEQNYTRSLRRDILQNQFITAVLRSTPIPSAQADLLHQYNETYRSSRLVEILSTPFMNIPAVDDQSLQAYFDENNEQFRQPEIRNVGIVDLSLDNVTQNIIINKTAFEEYFEDNRDAYSLPERRTVERILFTSEADARAAWLALQQGQDFLAVAKKFADAAPETVQLGEILRENYADSLLAEQVFQQELNTPSEPFEGLFGWMITRVTELKPAQETAFEDIQETLEAEMRRDQALNSVFDYVNQVEDLLAGGATMAEIAEDIDFPLQNQQVVMLDEDGSTPPLLRSQIRGLATVGDRQLFEDDAGGYRLVELQAINDSFIPEFSNITAEIRAAWQAEQQRKLALDQARVLADRVNGGEDLASVAGELQLLLRETEAVNRDGVPLRTEERDNFSVILPEAAHLSALFTLAPNVAVALPSSHGARVMVLGQEIVQETQTENPELRNALANASYFSFVESLRRKYPIEINRVALDYMYDVLNGNAQQRAPAQGY